MTPLKLDFSLDFQKSAAGALKLEVSHSLIDKYLNFCSNDRGRWGDLEYSLMGG
jgi:hypothetical protein